MGLQMDTTKKPLYIITAGSAYLDIDAYACCVAMAELLRIQGKNAVAYSAAPCNYSVSRSLIKEGDVLKDLPQTPLLKTAKYIIVDVSDPEFLGKSVPLEQVAEVYDHHVGFEDYWTRCIDNNAHIEFIGAAATLVYREWERALLHSKMSRQTALLMIAAILDNTLNLMSSNTTCEDIEVFNKLCEKEGVTKQWCAKYFSEVQLSVENDLENALFSDIKTIRNNSVLPSKVAQLCVWDAKSILEKLSDIRRMFADVTGEWMINLVDIKHRCSYFVCDSDYHQKELEKVFGISFQCGIAKTHIAYLRKEIIKKTLS